MADAFKGKISMEQRANWIAGEGNAAAQRIVDRARMAEKIVDEQINKMDNMTGDEFAILRQKRIAQMKKRQEMIMLWKQKGHGRYQELADQKEWFNESKTNERMICHFYRSSTERCQIVDKHLERIAPKHLETRIVKIDAEKCPFLCERLSIVLMPTIIMTKDNQAVDRIEGFDELGGVDNFTTETMEKRLAFQQIIDYEDVDLTIKGRQFAMGKGAEKGKISRSIKRGGHNRYEVDEDCDWSD